MRNKKTTWMLLLCLLSTTAPAADLQVVMKSLSTPASTPGLEAALVADLHQTAGLPPATAFVLANHLRLRLGAVRLQDGDYEGARTALQEVDADSPVAVQAALLLAETWRLQDKTQESVQWFLRTAKQYPADPAALHGLLVAGHEFEQAGDAGAAQTLYRQVVKQARETLLQLDALAAQPVVEPLQILAPSSALDEPVRKTLLGMLLGKPDQDLLGSTSSLQRDIGDLLELQQQNRQLSAQLELLARQAGDYQAERQRLLAVQQENTAQLATLTQQLRPDNFDQEQLEKRRAVTYLRNQVQRDTTTLKFIDDAIQKLPAIIDRVNSQQTILEKRLRQSLTTNRSAIQEMLTTSIASYRTQLNNTAGQALLDEGKMLENLASDSRPQTAP